MNVKCGIDIIEVSRIEKSINANQQFINRVFTEKEIQYCESKNKMKYQHYAARFAAKEAIFKAISELLENKYKIDWKNIEIENDEEGRPKANIIGVALASKIDIDVSLSHLKEYAIANCVVFWDASQNPDFGARQRRG